MSVEEMASAWDFYEVRLRELYERTGPELQLGEALNREHFGTLVRGLDEALVASMEIRLAAVSPLVESYNESYSRVTRMLLAAAAVDTMLAGDLAALDPYRGEAYGEGSELAIPEESFERIAIERRETLELASLMFRSRGEALPPAGGGGHTERRELIREVEQVTGKLCVDAQRPAARFVGGLLTIGIGDLLGIASATIHVEVMTRLQDAGQIIERHSPRFLREALAKLTVLGGEASEEASGEIVERASDFLAGARVLRSTLERIAAVHRANSHITSVIEGTADGASGAYVASLTVDLANLGQDFEVRMDLVDRTGKWLRRGGSLLAHLVSLALPGAGHAALAGAYVIGAGYVTYSLTDAIDARGLGIADRLEGVVPLVDRHLSPA